MIGKAKVDDGYYQKSRQVEESQSAAVYHYLFLVAVTLVAAALRLYSLGEWSLWIEEHHSLRDIIALDSFQKIFTYVRPLFFVLTKPVFTILGPSTWSARLVPAIIGIISVPLLYLVTKRLFNTRIAILASLLLALSPWHLYWSQNIRFYTLLLLLVNVSVFAFYWGLERDDFRYIIASIAALALAGATHPLAALLIPLLFLYFLLLKLLPFEKPPGLRLRYLIPFFVLPVAALVLYDLLRIFYLGDESLLSLLYTNFSRSSPASFIGYSHPYIMLTAVVYYVGTPLAFLSLAGTFYLLKEKRRSGLLLALGAYFPLLVLMVLTPVASTANRYVFMALPAWIILGAVGLWELYSRAKDHKVAVLAILGILLLLTRDPVVKDVLYYARTAPYFSLLFFVGIIVSFVGIFLFVRSMPERDRGTIIWGTGLLFVALAHPVITNGMYYAYQHGHRDNWQAVSTAVETEKMAGDVFVSSVTPLASYYLNEKVHLIHAVDLDAAIENGGRVWIVENLGVEQVISNEEKMWMSENCRLTGNWDQFTAGRTWKMRLHLCEHPAES